MHNRRIRAVVVSGLIGAVALGALAAAIVFRDIVAAFLHTGSADLALAMLKLDSPIAATRSTGARAIAKHGPAAHDAIPRLIDALDDSDPKIVSSIQFALARIGPATVPHLAELLQDPETTNIHPVIKVLGDLGSAGLPPLVDLLKHELPERRKAALHQLGRLRLDASAVPTIPEMVQLLEDPNADVREMAANALSHTKFQGASYVPLLIAKLHSQDKNVRISATWLLKQQDSGAVHALPELERGLSDEDPAVRIASLEAWCRIAKRTSVSVDPVVSMLDDSDPEVRKAAASHLHSWDSRSELIDRALASALRDPELDVRRDATRFAGFRMSWRKDPASSAILVPAFIISLQDSEADVRSPAAEALMHSSEYERDAAVPALLAALSDENCEVRAIAGRALGHLDRSTADIAVPVLAKLLDEPDSGVRYSALLGLTAFGPQAELAIPDLVRMSEMQSFHPDAWSVFTNTLAKIGEPALPALIGILQHPNHHARQAGIVALSAPIDSSEEVVLELVRRLQDADADVRFAAVESLAHRETRVDEIRKALMAVAAQDIDFRVRARAGWALNFIEDKLNLENATVKNENSGP